MSKETSPKAAKAVSKTLRDYRTARFQDRGRLGAQPEGKGKEVTRSRPAPGRALPTVGKGRWGQSV